MATLYVTATPIGNLEDITLRAIRILSEVDIILAEDTRQLAKLKSRFEATQPEYTINADIIRFDQHTEANQLTKIIRLLDEGKNIALVSDAGTPLLSDPGFLLIKTIHKHTDHHVVPVPGVSAVTSALSVSGLPPYPFCFLGFLPPKQGKLTTVLTSTLELHTAMPLTFVAFESPNRVDQTVSQMNAFCQENTCKIELVVLNELTKLHEKTVHINLPGIEDLPELKGEITLTWRFSV